MKRLSFFRLIRHKVLIFGLVMSSLPLLFISIYYFFEMAKVTEQNVIQRQQLQAENLANNIDSTIQTIYKHIEVLGSSRTYDESALYTLLSEHQSIDEIAVVNEEGIPATYISRNHINVWNAGERWPITMDQLVKTLSGEKRVFSGVNFNELGQPYIQLMSPIEDENKVIGVSLQLQKIVGELSSYKLQDNSSIYLLDETERIIAHQDYNRLWQQEILTSSTSDEVMVSAVPISDVDWMLVLEQPRKDMLSPIFSMLQRGGLVAMLLILFNSLISIFAGLYFVKPIERLQKAMRAVKHGKHPKKIDVDRNDEFGELTATFNEMNREIYEKSNRLLQEKERLNIIVNSMGAGLAILKNDYTVSWMNPILKKWVGSGENIPCFQLFNDKEAPCYTCPLTSGEDPEKSDELLTKKGADGEVRIFRHRVYRLQHTLGDGEEALIVMEDITEEKKMEEKLIQTDKLSALGLMASNFAHEVNNPLATVQVYAEDLADRLTFEKEELIESGEIENYLQIIRKNIDRCKEITKNLLNFSRKSKWTEEKIDVWQVLQDSLSLMMPTMKKKNINLQISEVTTIPPLYGDGIKLSQVFVNMIQNAIDAMEEKDDGLLIVDVKENNERGEIEISFQDNGVGIGEEDMQKLFDPFFTSKPVGKGTGLGLSVCYGIVEQFGGKIDVQSEKGRGTTFSISLPNNIEMKGGVNIEKRESVNR